MGLKDKVNEGIIKAQNAQSGALAQFMSDMLEKTMKQKCDRLRKEGRPVSVENLVSGCEALERVGLTREDVINVAEKYAEVK